jgi:hypothetical protein
MTERVEIKPAFFCTHPEPKQNQGCPARKHQKQIGHPMRCITVGYDGNSQTCNYLEAEVPEPKQKPQSWSMKEAKDSEQLRKDLKGFMGEQFVKKES